MNFQDFLRGAFGINPGRGFDDGQDGPRNGFLNPIWDDSDESDYSDDDLFGNAPSSPFGFSFDVFSGNILDMHKYFEQQLDDMMKSFRNMETFDFGHGLTQLPKEGAGTSRPAIEGNLRDKYLKPNALPDADLHSNKSDSDIDERVQSGGLSSLFKQDIIEPQVPRSVFKSRVIKKFIGPDGRVEEQKIEKNSDGNEVVTITRKLGDQVHSVVTRTEHSGVVEKHEELFNIDEDALTDFNKKWSNPRPSLPESNPDQKIKLFDNPFFRLFK